MIWRSAITAALLGALVASTATELWLGPRPAMAGTVYFAALLVAVIVVVRTGR